MLRGSLASHADLEQILATIAVIVLAIIVHQQSSSRDGKKTKSGGKRNLVFMVSDGMGPASLSMTRSFRQLQRSLPINDVLVLDQNLIGTSRTRSDDSLVTDSAAGATAFSCGLKSYNGAISMLPDYTPCGSVLEAAKAAGYMTGLVTTTRITDATPATFASHVLYRGEEDLIAQQEIGEHPLGRAVDLLMGGGRCHFMPNTTEGSCRGDDRDIISLAQEKHGWNYVHSKRDFDGLKLGSAVKLPLLALLANENMPFEIERRHVEDQWPSLKDMTQTALRALEAATQDSEKGFFLMVEAARIDHAGHGNDPAAQVHEVLAYDEAFTSVLDFLDNSSTTGALIASSDHDTGSLSVARQLTSDYPEYLWYPEVLVNVSHSAEYLSKQLKEYVADHDQISEKDLKSYIDEELVQNGMGILDATNEELERVVKHEIPTAYMFAAMISRRAQLGWTTHGHSAIDVNIYGSEGTETMRGNHENIEIGKFLSDYLSVDVDAVTHDLREKAEAHDSDVSAAWNFGRLPSEEDRMSVSRYYAEHSDLETSF